MLWGDNQFTLYQKGVEVAHVCLCDDSVVHTCVHHGPLLHYLLLPCSENYCVPPEASHGEQDECARVSCRRFSEGA